LKNQKGAVVRAMACERALARVSITATTEIAGERPVTSRSRALSRWWTANVFAAQTRST
jgi:hypothetical protein